MSKVHLRGTCASLVAVSCATNAFGDRIFVNAGAHAPGDGESWSTAYLDLQDALDEARNNLDENDEIWVAEGTYKPHLDERHVSFALIPGETVYGGFCGTEANLEERDNCLISGDGTFLSGDIGTPGIHTDNSRHVVSASGISEFDPRFIHLDRVSIMWGRADGDYLDNTANGAGLLRHDGGNVRLHDVVFKNNTATSAGAGAAVIDPFPAFTRCRFEENHVITGQALFRGGGALYIFNPATSPIDTRVYNCTFKGNSVEGVGGGAIFLDGEFADESEISNAAIVNCLIDNNTAQGGAGQGPGLGGYGGGILVLQQAKQPS